MRKKLANRIRFGNFLFNTPVSGSFLDIDYFYMYLCVHINTAKLFKTEQFSFIDIFLVSNSEIEVLDRTTKTFLSFQ